MSEAQEKDSHISSLRSLRSEQDAFRAGWLARDARQKGCWCGDCLDYETAEYLALARETIALVQHNEKEKDLSRLDPASAIAPVKLTNAANTEVDRD